MIARILPHNMSAADRAVRVLLSIAVLSLAFIGPRTAWGYLGLIPLLTGLAGRCPLYALFGFSTCPVRNAP